MFKVIDESKITMDKKALVSNDLTFFINFIQ
jgi:hypothetical protein